MKTNNGKRLIAALAIFVMVVCAFAMAMPSDEVNGAEGTVYEVSSEPTETQYADIPSAISAAEEKSETTFTVKLMSDVTGPGFVTDAGQNITIDLNTFTYTIDKCVGSEGTKSNGMQLLKDSTVKILNGTVTTTADALVDLTKNDGDNFVEHGAGIVIQNYSNLTLDDVTVDGTNLSTEFSSPIAYTLSNNNGVITITGNTVIKANEGQVAFDVYGSFQDYPSVFVTIDSEFTGEIIGEIEVWRGNGTSNVAPALTINADIDVSTIDVHAGTITIGPGVKVAADNITINVSSNDTAIITNNGNLSGNVEFKTSNNQIVMNEGASFSGTISHTASGITSSISVDNLVSGADDFIIKPGSIIISGTIDATEPVAITADGNVTISGKVITSESASEAGLTITDDGSGDSTVVIDGLTVKSNLTLAGNVVVSGNGMTIDSSATVTVNENVTMTVKSGSSVKLAGVLNNNGTVAGKVTTTSPSAEITGNDPSDGTTENITDYNELSNGASGNGWTYNGGILELNGYKGTGYFYDAGIKEVKLVGNNSISIDAKIITYANFGAIRSDGAFIISGDGSLEIKITGSVTAVNTTSVSGILSISGGITIGALVSIDNQATLSSNNVYGIYAMSGSVVLQTGADVSGKIPGDVIVKNNLDLDSLDITGQLTVNEKVTLVTGDLTVGGFDNKGVVIVTGELNYNGDDSPRVQVGLPAAVSSGSVYFTGDVNSLSENVQIYQTSNPVEVTEDTYVTSVVPENDKAITQSNILIVSDGTVTFDGQTITKDYTVIGGADGSVIIGGGKITAIATNLTILDSEGAETSVIYTSEKAVTVSIVDGTVVIDGDITALTLSAEVPATVNGSMASGTITGNNSTISITNVDLTGLVMTAGSVEINGAFEFNGTSGTSGTITGNGGDLVITDNTTITGKGTITVGKLTVNEGVTLTIGKDVVIDVQVGAELVVKEDAVITGEGKIKLAGTGITNDGTIEVTVDPASTDKSITIDVGEDMTLATQQFINALAYYDIININGNLTLTGTDLEIEVDDVEIRSNGTLTIGETVYVYFEKVTFTGANITTSAESGDVYVPNNNGKIKVIGELYISNSDVYANVYIPDPETYEDALISVTGPKTMEVGKQTVGNLGDVGYGNVMSIVGDFSIDNRASLNVFGTLNVTGNLTVASNATITIYGAGDLNVTGTLEMDGSVAVHGSADISGEMTVGETGTVYIDTAGDFDVTGTMTMNGALAGTVVNHGTVAFAGTVEDGTVAEIKGMQGSATTVTSVDGELRISDDGAATDAKGEVSDRDKEKYAYLDGDYMTITDMAATAGESVSVSVSVGTETVKVGTVNVTVYIASMDVAGTVSADIDIVAVGGVTVSQTLDVTGDVGYAKNGDAEVEYSVPGTSFSAIDIGVLTVSGTMNVDGAFAAQSGTVTVTGEVSVKADKLADAEISGDATINATYYTVSTAATQTEAAYVTGYYTSFDAAIRNIANADKDTITVMGEQTVSADATVADKQTVVVSAGAVLTVGKGVTLTVAKGGVMEDNAYNGTADTDATEGVFVNGTLTFEDFKTGYDAVRNAKPLADVVVENDPARTFMSLAGAIDAGMTEIVLNQNVTITEDLTIPAGVTVSSDEYGITVAFPEKPVADVTLTVEGAVELTKESAGFELDDAEDITGKNYETALVVAGEDGYVMVNTEDDIDNTSGDFDVDTIVGAHYYLDVTEGRTTNSYYVISTVEKAADNSANVTFDAEGIATITITGQLTIDSVEFIAPTDDAITVTLIVGVVNIDEDNASSLRFSEIVLGQNVMFGSEDAELTGAVVMQNDEGALVSEVDLNRAVGIGILVHEEPETDDAPAYDCMTIAGTVTYGSVTVAAGTVAVEEELTVTNDAVYTGRLVVAQGAVLNVAETDGDLSIDGTAKYIAMTVEGTLVIEGDADIVGAQIDGTVTVKSGMAGFSNVTVNGTVDVVEEEKANNVLTVYGPVTVGSKPTQLGTAAGTGTIAGAVNLSYKVGGITYYGTIKAYPGSDLTGAKIDIINDESTAESTVFNINDETYMTVYVAQNAYKAIANVLMDEEFELVGLFNGLNYYNNDPDAGTVNTGLYYICNWYSDASMAGNKALDEDDDIGIETVYAHAEPATVTGTFSVGTGITLYVDDVPVTSGNNATLTVGTHTVRFDIQAGYDGSKAVVTFNGQTVQNNGTVTVEVGAATFNLTASGAVPAQSGGDVVVNPPEVVVNNESNDDMALTDILLIVLVILIVIMAIIVALRMMRS